MFKSIAAKTSASLLSLMAILLLITTVISGMTAAVHAQAPPSMPHRFYGYVYNNGQLVGSNYTVVAKSGVLSLTTATTDSQGRYGAAAPFQIMASDGLLIEFYVNDVKASQTAVFSQGSVTKRDINVTGAPSPGTPATSCGITTASLPAGTVGTAYSASLAASGGTTPYTWSVASGTLPAGLTVSSTSGIISGTPTAAQTANFTVQANDSAAHACSKALTLQVNAAGTAATVTSISASILGGTDSFSLSNGVISAAKSLSSSDGRVKLDLAANTSVNMQGLLQLGAATESNPQAAADGSILIRAYSFVPSGATFSPAATMTLKYETASLPAGASESGLYLAFWNGTAWEKLSSSLNTTLKEISAPVAHFTVFAIRYAPPATTTTTTTPTPATTDTTTTTTTTPTPTPATATSTTVTANVLGTSGSFSMSGGTVPSATSLSSSNGRMGISLAANTAVSLPAGSQQVTVIQLASAPTPPANSKVIEAYSFGPDNTTFSPAASVTVKYDPATLPSDVQESNLYLALLENSNWTEVPCTVDAVAKTVTAQVSHFSTYALLGRVTAAPATPAATPGTPAAPATTPATTPAAPGGEAASGMSTFILIIIVAGGLLVIVLAIILIMRQRSSY